MQNSYPAHLFEEIVRYPNIAVFRHQFPDPDAYGSQQGLAAWLRDRFPEKKILEADSGHEIEEADLNQTLAIILDTSNAARVDGQSWKQAARIARVDHHVKVEEMADADLDEVDDLAAATCELVPLILKKLGQTIPAAGAQKLLEGLMADTQRFTISAVRPETFEAAAWLIEQGANPVTAAEELFSRSYARFEYGAKVARKACLKDHLLFSVMDTDDYLSLGMDFSQAKEFVNELNNVAEAEIWALFTRMDDGIHYSASLRSRHYSVRDIAAEYGGGGHEKASGIKNLTQVQVFEIINRLRARSLEERQD